MTQLIPAIRLLEQGDFTVDRPEISRGGEGRVLAGSITAPPACNLCAVKESHFFATPEVFGLDAEGVERTAQDLRKQLNGWAAMTPHPNLLPLLGVSIGNVTIRLPRPAVVPNIPLRIFSPLYPTTVEQWLTTEGRQLCDDALAEKLTGIVRQVVAGLAHMHSFGLVHRDLKCNNLFCNADASEAVVGDLGLIAHNAHASIHGSLQGNPIHMAPEMAWIDQRQRRRFSVKADVWSLGMLLLEMLQLARNDGLEGYVFNNFAQKMMFDADHNADPTDTPPRQSEMQQVVNEALQQQNYASSICRLFLMTTRQQSGVASSLLDVALQLDRRHRASMEHCAVLMDLHQLRDENTALRDQMAAERNEHKKQHCELLAQLHDRHRQIEELERQLQTRQQELDRALGTAAAQAAEIASESACREEAILHKSAQHALLQNELAAVRNGAAAPRACRQLSGPSASSVHRDPLVDAPIPAAALAQSPRPEKNTFEQNLKKDKEYLQQVKMHKTLEEFVVVALRAKPENLFCFLRQWADEKNPDKASIPAVVAAKAS